MSNTKQKQVSQNSTFNGKQLKVQLIQLYSTKLDYNSIWFSSDIV